LAKYRDEDLFAARSTSDEALMNHIRDKADTIYHPVAPPRWVSMTRQWNPRLCVNGLHGLRIVDASEVKYPK
jgi:hypothetical protein